MFMFTVEIGISPESLSPGLLQTSCFSTGFANGHYSIQVSSALNSVGLVYRITVMYHCCLNLPLASSSPFLLPLPLPRSPLPPLSFPSFPSCPLAHHPLQYFSLLVSFLQVNQSLTLQTHVFASLRAFIHKVNTYSVRKMRSLGACKLPFGKH